MKIDKSLMAGSTVLLVLKLLSEGEKYGYEMIQELAAKSDNTFELKEGTLYPILHNLEKTKCVESSTRETAGGRKRKYYRITEKGRGQLKEKTEEWRHFSEKVSTLVLGQGLSAAPQSL